MSRCGFTCYGCVWVLEKNSLSTMFVEKFKTSNERFPKLNMNYMTTNRIG